MNTQITKMCACDISSLMSMVKNAAEKQPTQKQYHYIVFAGHEARVVNKHTGIFVSQLRIVSDLSLFNSNTTMPASKILEFADFCDTYNVRDVEAYFVQYADNNLGIRVMFEYGGYCDYYWQLTPLTKIGGNNG